MFSSGICYYKWFDLLLGPMLLVCDERELCCAHVLKILKQGEGGVGVASIRYRYSVLLLVHRSSHYIQHKLQCCTLTKYLADSGFKVIQLFKNLTVLDVCT